MNPTKRSKAVQAAAAGLGRTPAKLNQLLDARPELESSLAGVAEAVDAVAEAIDTTPAPKAKTPDSKTK